MSDFYEEIIVKKTPSKQDAAKKAVLVAVVSGLVLGGLCISIYLLLIAIIAGIVVSYFLLPKFDVEYEYLIVDKELDIDAVYAKTKRKKLEQLQLEEMVILAPLQSLRMEYYNGNTQMGVKDYTSGNSDASIYCMVIRSHQKTEKFLLELNQTAMDHLRRSYPNKVFLD